MTRTPSRSLQVTAVAVGAVGLVMSGISVMYIAGLFGISTAFASQVVSAVSVGGWVLAIVMAAMTGGTAGVMVATTRWAIAKWGEKVAIA